MAQNKLPGSFVLYILFSLIICTNVFSQDNSNMPEAGYFIDYSEASPRIMQRLVWEKEEYALRYEAEIQIYEDFYYPFFLESTENIFIELNLPPGRYRYRVTPFDLLGQRGDPTEWKQIEIIAAFLPQVVRFLPDRFFMDRNQDRVLNLAGINFQPESVIYLSNSSNKLTPVTLNIINNERAVLVFDDMELIPGDYFICIQNPGGLETKTGGFNIGYQKPFDVFIRAAYTPVVPLFGELNEVGINLYLQGYSLGFEFISSSRTSLHGGMELGASVFFLNSLATFSSDYEGIKNKFNNADNGAFIANLDLNFSLQKRYNKLKNAFTFRFGCGSSFFSGFGDINVGGQTIHFNANISNMFLLYEILNLDAGVDFTVYFTKNPTGTIRPRIGLIWRL